MQLPSIPPETPRPCSTDKDATPRRACSRRSSPGTSLRVWLTILTILSFPPLCVFVAIRVTDSGAPKLHAVASTASPPAAAAAVREAAPGAAPSSREISAAASASAATETSLPQSPDIPPPLGVEAEGADGDAEDVAHAPYEAGGAGDTGTQETRMGADLPEAAKSGPGRRDTNCRTVVQRDSKTNWILNLRGLGITPSGTR
jgi:hypothetical protein